MCKKDNIMKHTYQLTASDHTIAFVTTDMDEDTLADAVINFKKENNSMLEIAKFMEFINTKGEYEINYADNQNPDKYFGEDKLMKLEFPN